MGIHKVPQDVEVADKILGPLSFKQLIFAILFFGSIYIGYVLFKAFPLLVVIVLPFIIVSGVLAFYQRPDQPVEVYLMSAMKFYTASRKKIWDTSGYEERVEITEPKTINIQRTKDLTSNEISMGLDNLSKLMDTHGWASRNADSLQNMGLTSDDRLMTISDIHTIPSSNTEVESGQQNDILDSNETQLARKFNNMVEQRALQIRQQMVAQVQVSNTNNIDQRQSAPTTTQTPNTSPINNEYSHNQINQLVNNNDLSIALISKQANKIQGENTLSLR